MDKITIADVAMEAGVSKSTVSQFLNKRYEYMGQDTKKKIEEAIEKLGYQPNYLARSLKQKRTSTIGIIVANIMHRFSTEVSRAIEDFCHQHDIHVIVCNADEDPEKEKKYIEMLRAKQVDGLIIFPTGQNTELYTKMVKSKYPVVFMDRKVKGISAHSVIVNNKEATSDAVSHLFEKGHRQIAIVTLPLTISTRKERIEGYKKALLQHNMEINPSYMICTDIKNMEQALEQLFSLEFPPTALIAGNDLVFFEVLKFLKEKQIAVPSECALIVFDNVPFAHVANPSVTTIMQPAFEMGRKAAQILLAQIKNEEEKKPEEIIFPCQLILRESSMISR